MYTADPGPITGIRIVDPSLSLMVLIFGIFVAVVGIIIGAVVYRESREWKKMILPIFDRGSAETASESGEGSGGVMLQRAALNKEIFSRIFGHMDIAGLLGGAATFVMGILIVLIGLTLSS